jgi:hypothetical protein
MSGVSVRRPALLADRHASGEEMKYKEGGGSLLCFVVFESVYASVGIPSCFCKQQTDKLL